MQINANTIVIADPMINEPTVTYQCNQIERRTHKRITKKQQQWIFNSTIFTFSENIYVCTVINFNSSIFMVLLLVYREDNSMRANGVQTLFSKVLCSPD